MAGQATDDRIIWHMRFACWMTNADTVIMCNTVAFRRQLWFHVRASVYILKNIDYLVENEPALLS